MELAEVMTLLDRLPPEAQAQLVQKAQETKAVRLWAPNPGPQSEAYYSKADLLLYGGQGGGGKSDLIAGLALTQHRHSLVMRREHTNLGALIERVLSIYGTRDGFNGQSPARLRTINGRIINFGAAKNLGDEDAWQGQAHDFQGFDEATQFLEEQIRFLMGWNRPREEGDSTQRCRVVLASNPPLSADGQWVIGMFRPWLDPAYKNKARPGELRYYITDPDGKDMEVNGPDDAREWGGEIYRPLARTFIPAKLSDNPGLVATNYQATLDAMPEPMRSAIRDGNFMAAREDEPFQIIKTTWVLAANERWLARKDTAKANHDMTALGLDIARGGRDATVLAPRYDTWFDEITSVPGKDTPDGPSVVGLVATTLRDGACVNLDAIGVGGSVQDHMKAMDLHFVPLNGARRSLKTTKDGKFGFANERAALWWKFREALDPDYGSQMALPPDPELQADLTTPLFRVTNGDPAKIIVESKEDIIKRLGRSPDKGDAVVYAWNDNQTGINRHKKPIDYGDSNLKRRRFI